MEIRRISPEELPLALELVKRVFMRFEAPDYSQQGIDTFFAFLSNPVATCALKIYGAFIDRALVGVLATRGNSHISLFFVDAEHQGKGIGRALFTVVKNECASDFMTVNSSPYAVKIYKRLGFSPISDEQMTDGIRFTPMKCILRNEPSEQSL